MDALASGSGLSGGARTARLALAFAKDGRGRTFLSRQYAGYPFHVCKTLYEDDALPGMGTIYTQSSAGGLYEHDRHTIEILAKAGAQAHVTTQASTIVHSMAHGTAEQDTVIRAEHDSYLEVLPDPQILFPHASYSGTTRIVAAESACVLFSESFLTHDPDGEGKVPQSYRSEIIVENLDGRRLAIDRMALASDSFEASAPGVLGGFRACGTLLVIAPGRGTRARETTDLKDTGALLGMSLLPNGAGYFFRVLATDGVHLKRSLYDCWCWARVAIAGSRPQARRK